MGFDMLNKIDHATKRQLVMLALLWLACVLVIVLVDVSQNVFICSVFVYLQFTLVCVSIQHIWFTPSSQLDF